MGADRAAGNDGRYALGDVAAFPSVACGAIGWSVHLWYVDAATGKVLLMAKKKRKRASLRKAHEMVDRTVDGLVKSGRLTEANAAGCVYRVGGARQTKVNRGKNTGRPIRI